MIKGLRLFQTKDVELNRVYQNVSKFAQQFVGNPLLEGLVIKDLTVLSASGLTVSHGLGRDIQGWVVIRKGAQADVWEASNQPTASKTLVLESSANVTISLYVF